MRSPCAQDQDGAENRLRKAWQEPIEQIDTRHWVFVDRSGETTEMIRRYGRVPCGERVREATPAGHVVREVRLHIGQRWW